MNPGSSFATARKSPKSSKSSHCRVSTSGSPLATRTAKPESVWAATSTSPVPTPPDPSLRRQQAFGDVGELVAFGLLARHVAPGGEPPVPRALVHEDAHP